MVSMDQPVTAASAVVTSEQTEGPPTIASLISADPWKPDSTTIPPGSSTSRVDHCWQKSTSPSRRILHNLTEQSFLWAATRMLSWPARSSDCPRSSPCNGFLSLNDTADRNGSIATMASIQESVMVGVISDDPVLSSTSRDAQHICGECGKAFREAKKLRRHSAVHDSVERYTCEVCGRGFKDSSNYNRHLGTHSDRKQHVCSVCLKNFQNPQTLSKHSVTRHASAKRFMCDVCQSGFNDSSNFKRHLRIHTNEVARFVCGSCREKYPEVEFLKDLTSTLLQPSSTKTSVNGLHMCRVCNKNLVYPLSHPPRRSLQPNGGEKKHICPTCGKRFTTTGHLKQHSVVHGSVSTRSSQVSV